MSRRLDAERKLNRPARFAISSLFSAVCLAILTWHTLPLSPDLLIRGLTAEAEVAERVLRDYGWNYLDVRFDAGDGPKLSSVPAGDAFFAATQVGDSVEVWYLPERPGVAALAHGFPVDNAFLFTAGLFLAATVIFVVSIVLLIRRY
ncbi:MAG: DUF3592 domain-containing protein [Pseudomonadota bacterium]